MSSLATASNAVSTASTIQLGDEFSTLQNLVATLADPDLGGFKFYILQNDNLNCEYKATHITQAEKGAGFNTNCQAYVKTVPDGVRYRIVGFNLYHNHSILPVSVNSEAAPIIFNTVNGRIVLPTLNTTFKGRKYSMFKSIAQYGIENSLTLDLRASGIPRRNDFKFVCNHQGCSWTWRVSKQSGGWIVQEFQTAHSHPVVLPPISSGLGTATPTPPSCDIPQFPSVHQPAQTSIVQKPRATFNRSEIHRFLLQADQSGRLLKYVDHFVAQEVDQQTLLQLPPELLEKFLVDDLGLPWLHFALIASYLDKQKVST